MHQNGETTDGKINSFRFNILFPASCFTDSSVWNLLMTLKYLYIKSTLTFFEWFKEKLKNNNNTVNK